MSLVITTDSIRYGIWDSLVASFGRRYQPGPRVFWGCFDDVVDALVVVSLGHDDGLERLSTCREWSDHVRGFVLECGDVVEAFARFLVELPLLSGGCYELGRPYFFQRDDMQDMFDVVHDFFKVAVVGEERRIVDLVKGLSALCVLSVGCFVRFGVESEDAIAFASVVWRLVQKATAGKMETVSGGLVFSQRCNATSIREDFDELRLCFSGSFVGGGRRLSQLTVCDLDLLSLVNVVRSSDISDGVAGLSVSEGGWRVRGNC